MQPARYIEPIDVRTSLQYSTITNEAVACNSDDPGAHILDDDDGITLVADGSPEAMRYHEWMANVLKHAN